MRISIALADLLFPFHNDAAQKERRNKDNVMG